MGRRLCILGHHYQRSSVLSHADETGDSLELSRKAAGRRDAERIVFCGVHFMAESADILTGPAQAVYMPDPTAGCPMASMAADADAVMVAWQRLSDAGSGWLPVVYVNSTAASKAFCGRNGGSTCTSSNAGRVMSWAFAQGKRVFFLPDEHLGANTAHDLSILDENVAVYDPFLPGGGIPDNALRRAQVVVWKGFCIVHAAFTAEHVRIAREKLPGAKIIVHPETPKEVVRLCDAHGSTSQIIQYVEAAPSGSTVVVGTELNLVSRLAERHEGRVTVKALAPSVCANMSRTSEQNLLELLQTWPDHCRVRVPEAEAAEARTSLERMLSL
jgi:quinolinate synthase